MATSWPHLRGRTADAKPDIQGGWRKRQPGRSLARPSCPFLRADCVLEAEPGNNQESEAQAAHHLWRRLSCK